MRHSESSMRNGFGLKLLHKFFNLPFLQLQRETLLKQLERNQIETNTTIQELDLFCDSDEANYSKFLDTLTKKRREAADSHANIPPPQINNAAPPNVNAAGPEIKRSQSGPIVIGAGQPIPYGNLNQALKPPNPTPYVSKSSSMSSGFVSKVGVDNGVSDVVPDLRKLEISPITSVEEFCPDGGQLTGFLDDVQYNVQTNVKETIIESDS